MVGKQDAAESKSHEVLLMPRLYDEALQLVMEAHGYFSLQGNKDQEKLKERDRIMYTSEMSRITIRLSCVLAWLMARKAVFVGQISDEEADKKHYLEQKEASLHQNIEAESVLPRKMVDLLDKTYELYQRVARLDKQKPNS